MVADERATSASLAPVRSDEFFQPRPPVSSRRSGDPACVNSRPPLKRQCAAAAAPVSRCSRSNGNCWIFPFRAVIAAGVRSISGLASITEALSTRMLQ